VSIRFEAFFSYKFYDFRVGRYGKFFISNNTSYIDILKELPTAYDTKTPTIIGIR
jgi:hypothetical protein